MAAASSSSSRFDVDEMIYKLLNVGAPGCSLTKTVEEEEFVQLCRLAKDVLMPQGSLVELDPPVRICGDTHGQYPDLLRLFDRGGFPPKANYLFLGDYVDRGRQNLETIGLLMCYKVKYPEHFFLLRGNHECSAINRVYGFLEECNRRYSQRVWHAFQDAFNCMPFCALVGTRILCMHGGLSPKLENLEQLRHLARPNDPPNPSLQIDLLWSDPDFYTEGYKANARGVSYVFGADVVVDMCRKMDLDLIVRTHQVVQDGYEFFSGRKLVTIFSAPHYCGQFANAAAMMMVDESLRCSFLVLKPTSGPISLNTVPATCLSNDN